MSTVHGGPGNIVTNGLVLYLDAANYNSYTSGSTTWRDLSGNGFNGTLTNGPVFNSANVGSIVFDGVDDYGIIPNSNNLVFGNGDFTVSLWMKFPISSVGEGNPSQWGPIISKGCSTQAPAGTWWIAQTSTTNNSATFNISSTSGGAFVCSVTTRTLTDGWHNICAIRSGSTSSMYADGVLKTSDLSSDSDLSSTRPLTICSTFTTLITSKFTSTSIANIQLYNKALTSTEILQNFNATRARFGI